jgi:hypothetical protein
MVQLPHEIYPTIWYSRLKQQDPSLKILTSHAVTNDYIYKQQIILQIKKKTVPKYQNFHLNVKCYGNF